MNHLLLIFSFSLPRFYTLLELIKDNETYDPGIVFLTPIVDSHLSRGRTTDRSFTLTSGSRCCLTWDRCGTYSNLHLKRGLKGLFWVSYTVELNSDHSEIRLKSSWTSLKTTLFTHKKVNDSTPLNKNFVLVFFRDYVILKKIFRIEVLNNKLSFFIITWE